ncbi:hypothetical protein JJE63_02490 [Alloprevotella tannerae]|uniref:hypothetical protein n=1 Tax=Alloprevotella tannerae TaxID=76122 RepID=UPI001EDC06F9|nr:hypothetical protein [Alloprevotella tannerae]MCG2652204.1 hypothetical protein [Alloprevotella tannerae]
MPANNGLTPANDGLFPPNDGLLPPNETIAEGRNRKLSLFALKDEALSMGLLM